MDAITEAMPPALLGSDRIEWFNSVPDADTTVLTQSTTSDEPIWLGYWDGQIWRDIEGFPRDVIAWAHLPLGLLLPALFVEGVKA